MMAMTGGLLHLTLQLDADSTYPIHLSASMYTTLQLQRAHSAQSCGRSRQMNELHNPLEKEQVWD